MNCSFKNYSKVSYIILLNIFMFLLKYCNVNSMQLIKQLDILLDILYIKLRKFIHENSAIKTIIFRRNINSMRFLLN